MSSPINTIHTAELPTIGFVRQRQLIGSAGVSTEQADMNRRRGKGPRKPRPARVGIVPFSCATLWRMVKAGEFPSPLRLSKRVTAWTVEDVRKWIESRSAKQCE